MNEPGHSTRTRTILSNAAVLAAIMLIAAAPRVALASTATYRIDPGHSNVGFRVSHLVFSKVSGRFNKFEGTIVFDPAAPAGGSVSVTIDAASIDTNEPARDKHLRSDAFFDVETHPAITFQSTRVGKTGDKGLRVEGTLTIRGTSKPVTLEVEILGVGPDGYGGYRAGFEGRARINRHDFGVSWNDLVEGGGLMVGNEVELILGVEAIREKTPEAEAGMEGR